MQTEFIQFFQRKVYFGQRQTGRGRPWEQSSSSLTGNDSPQKAQSFLPALFPRRSWLHWPSKGTCLSESGDLVRDRWAQDHPRLMKKFCEARQLGQILVMETSNRPAHHQYPLSCPYPKPTPRELLWLRAEPLSHEGRSPYCTQSHTAALPASDFYL